MFESCADKDSPEGHLIYLGDFDNQYILFDMINDVYCQLEKSQIIRASDEFWNEEEDTYGTPIFPDYKVKDKIVLPSGFEVTIIAVAPMLPPHSTVFEYMVMDEEGHIFTVTEPGYIPEKYLIK